MEENKQDLLLLQAQQAVDERAWSQALALYEELYQIEQNLAVNQQLVNLAVRLEQFQLAQQYLLDYVEKYLGTNDDVDNVILIFTKNQNYILCHEIINKITSPTLYQHTQQALTLKEDEARTILQATFKARAREFKYLGMHDFAAQYHSYQTGLQLPLREHLAIARNLLLDEDVSDLVRITILASFMALKVKDEVSFLWLDNTVYTRKFSELVPPLATETAFIIQDTLYEELENTDPVTLAGLEQNIILRIRAAFPFVEQVITDPVTWTKYQIARFRGEELPDLNENDIRWLLKFDALFAKIGN
ncbi:hypothetical protein [Periweissella ghanensis]|uniref:Uncharacterized protein n=1 Tax=Periweissella ghanensis TaxID=467997 RepID=A0ABM8ZAK2_9LACO|nr:hypothetical protein [Periweissella ghanensis]MCM0601769.1 hypothetical protein [Periweissella ghanensis]CAH0418201.1 hypothetical protein WGH24286_00617 [Periweissella ghanensis]